MIVLHETGTFDDGVTAKETACGKTKGSGVFLGPWVAFRPKRLPSWGVQFD